VNSNAYVMDLDSPGEVDRARCEVVVRSRVE